MSTKKEFKAESKRLLEMMINSIYTHKEIFLRELISNASDALDKLYFKSLSENIGKTRDEYFISITPDKDAKTLTITDNGIGMTKDDLENNLGIIANSGSLAFKTENKSDDVNIIGQFGVGFYSAFMIAKEVIVKSKAYGSEQGYVWTSTGADGYTVEETEKAEYGTEITLVLKEDSEDNKYSEYLETFKLQNLIKKYSDYIRYPIKLPVTSQVPVECHGEHAEGEECNHEPVYTDVTEIKTINSMTPIWKKNKSELTDEEYNNFYKSQFNEYSDPIIHSHVKNEGAVSYDALLFVPANAPYNFYSKDFEKGLQLYSNGVMIMQKCKDLLPDYFGFVKGLVDSEDFSLNISREILQHDRQLKLIAKNIEKTIKNELTKMLKNNREEYEKFYKEFGRTLKFGIYEQFGANKDVLKDLVLFYSSTEKKLVTFAEYKDRMVENQGFIYYAAGKSNEAIDVSPKTEAIREKGYEILYFTDDVDEFVVQVMREYDGVEFKSVSAADLNVQSEEEKKATEEKSKEYSELLTAIKTALGAKVTDVKLSNRLTTHPVCLSSGGGISVEMQEILKQMPNAGMFESAPVLEINPNHAIFTKLQHMFEDNKDSINDYAKLLLGQAKLIEGIQIENPAEFAELVANLMI